MRIIALFSLALCVIALGACGSSKKKDPVGVDLTISGTPTYTPATPTSDDTITVSFTITNSGTKGTANVPWSAYLEGDPIASGSVAMLGPAGVSGVQSFTMHALEGGSHTLSVVVDPANIIAEDNNANNGLSFPVTFTTVPAKLDLGFFTAPAVSPTSPTTNDAHINFSIRNTDTSATSTTAINVHWHIYENGVSLGSNTIASIPAGGSQVQSFDLTPTSGRTAGSHTFTIVIDPHHGIVESDESAASNSAAITVMIMQAAFM